MELDMYLQVPPPVPSQVPRQVPSPVTDIHASKLCCMDLPDFELVILNQYVLIESRSCYVLIVCGMEMGNHCEFTSIEPPVEELLQFE